MPLYIKSPMNSVSNLSTTAAAIQSSILALMSSSDGPAEAEVGETQPVAPPAAVAKVSSLPRFAMVRCGRRKAQEMLLKSSHADPDAATSGQGHGQPHEVNCRPSSTTALTKSKVSLSALKDLIMATTATGVKQRGTARPPPLKTVVPLSIPTVSPPGPLHASNTFAEQPQQEQDAIREAVALLQASAQSLFQKLELHPETLKQIVEWETSPSQIPSAQESVPRLRFPGPSGPTPAWCAVTKRKPTAAAPGAPVVKLDWNSSNPRPRPSTSSYFPNTTASIPCRRAYKYADSTPCDTPIPSTPKFLLGVRESLSNISMVPFVSSSCASALSSPRDSTHSDFAESEISDIQISGGRKHRKKKLGNKTSLPAIRSKMKKLMRTLSDMNAVPEVMDIFMDNLPPVAKISPDHLQRLKAHRGTPPVLGGKEVKADELASDGIGDEEDRDGIKGGDAPVPVLRCPSSGVIREDKSDGMLRVPEFTLRPMTTAAAVGRAGLKSGIPRRIGSSVHVNAVSSSPYYKSVVKAKNAVGMKTSVELGTNPGLLIPKSKGLKLKK